MRVYQYIGIYTRVLVNVHIKLHICAYSPKHLHVNIYGVSKYKYLTCICAGEPRCVHAYLYISFTYTYINFQSFHSLTLSTCQRSILYTPMQICLVLQDVNTSRPGNHRMLLSGLVDDAVRQAELQGMQAKTILGCIQSEEEAAASAGSAAITTTDCADTAAAGNEETADVLSSEYHLSNRRRKCHQAQIPTFEYSATTSKRQRPNGTAEGIATEAAASATAATGASNGSRGQTRLDSIPELREKALVSPPRFLCSNTTLIICPPFLSRHWEAQIDQWFGWDHLSSADRIKVHMLLSPYTSDAGCLCVS